MISGMPGRSVFPSLMAAALAISAAPATAGGRPVTFASLDGVVLSGQIYEAGTRPAPGVVLVHMLSRSRADWDGPAMVLQALGVTALAVDLRGHGGSSGAADLPDMVQDVRAAVQFLSGQQGVRPDRIGRAGASLGANLALLAAASEPSIRAIAAVSPSLDYRGVRVGAETMRRIGERPVWLAASTEDPFALRTIQDLAAGGSSAREQRLSPVAGHGSMLLLGDPELARALVDWLHQRLLS